MTKLTKFASGLLTAGLLAAAPALAQCPTGVVGFNGPPINDPAAAFEMFRIPQFSGTTSAFIVANTSGNNNNSTFRASGFQTEGDAALETFFDWSNPANSDSWLRLSTQGGALRPNPALHTEGKVRFRIKNLGNFISGRIGICLGVRESGVSAAQLADGGITGPIEWVGTSTTPSVITAGLDGNLDSAVAGDDELRTLTAGSAIVAGLNGVLDSAAAGDDVVGAGFTYTNASPAERRPIPAITLNVSAAALLLEWNLATGVVSIDGVPQTSGISGFTGDNDLSVPNNRGTLEHLAITVNTGTRVRFIVDELQFEAPESDPLLAPTVASPIIAGDTTVRVTAINSCINQVNLLRNNVVIQSQSPSPNTDVSFTIAPAVAGDVYTATQRDSQSGQTSAQSAPVTVTTGPPTYGISFVLDEDGDGSCAFTAPGGWEFVGVDTLTTRADSDLYPNGQGVFTNSAVWQTVDFDLTNANLVTAWLGGDGDVDISTTGNYTFDSLWFNSLPSGTVGPHEVFIDAIQVLDAGNNVLQTIHSFEDGRNFLSNARGQSTVAAPTITQNSTLASYDGRTSRRLVWTFGSADQQQSLGQLFREGTSCGTGTHVQFTDDGTKIRFRIVARGTPLNALALPTVVGPIVQGTVNIRVTNAATATATRLYINGVAFGAPGTPAGGVTDFNGVTVVAGDSISATQTIDGVDSDFAYPKAVLAAPIPPATPTIQAPVEDGDTSVGVAGVSIDTTLVEILNGATVLGSLAVSSPGATVSVPISGGLEHLQSLTVRASNAAGSSTSPPAAAIEVGIGNGEILVCIGVRDAQEAGPLGSVGAITTGQIEWIGATGNIGGAPQGVPVSPSDSWQTLTFDPAVGPIASALGVGNGVIDNTRGSLEHLAVSMNSTAAGRSSGGYVIYVDNVINVGADNGSDFLISNFDSFTAGVEALFQEPGFSGSTSANLVTPPNISAVSTVEGNPGQSASLEFFVRNTAANRWIRLTTSGATNLSRPVIDLTRPIRMDILLRPTAAPVIPGDVDGDGDVDLSDLSLLLSSFGSCVGDANFQPGADFNASGCIELADLAVLLSNFGS